MFSEVSVIHSVHNRPHGYSVTAHPWYGAVGTHPTKMLSWYSNVFVDPLQLSIDEGSLTSKYFHLSLRRLKTPESARV